LDGKNADDITNTVVIKADRAKIANQITAFNKNVEEVLKKIPTKATDVEKEKYIYDYLQDHISYDYEAAKLIAQEGVIASHAFDAYGAICEGQAVCEGYAELFQYLCYCVGINATQVCGTANGGAHMWNTAYIDSEWYMLDVTWDDQGKDGLHYYTYFNLTSNDMSQKKHVSDTTNIRVPDCTSSKHAFYVDFALYVENLNTVPSNYKTVLDEVVKNKDIYLVIYAGNQTNKMSIYIRDYLVSQSSEVQKYIKSKGYDIKFASTYYISDGYCYIRIK
jgi:transglutaminase/protease-like cytokinesis protein 3